MTESYKVKLLYRNRYFDRETDQPIEREFTTLEIAKGFAQKANDMKNKVDWFFEYFGIWGYVTEIVGVFKVMEEKVEY